LQARENLVEPLLDLCREAGDAICAHYRAPGPDRVRTKEDDSPLTQADLVSDRVLQAGLQALAPSLPVLSEENVEAGAGQRLDWTTYWLVDPLDGTKEFLARTGEFTINIALIEDHLPRLGVLYLPLEQAAYVGLPGSGARRYRLGEAGWSAQPLRTRRLAPGAPLVVLASRRHRGGRLDGSLQWLADNWGEVERRDSGSALKFCQLAAGQGDCYPRFSRCCEWDTAAGQALLEAAGGALLGMDGSPLRYNCRDTLYSPRFLALADPAHPLWPGLLAHMAAA